jgi:hypothetical protein
MIDEDKPINEALAYDAIEAERLSRGEIALTHEHLYFAWGDIFDVYIARKCPPDDAHVFHLIKCDPSIEIEIPLETMLPTLGIRKNGQLDLFDSKHEIQPTRWDVRSFYPFGPKQLEWYLQYRPGNSDAETSKTTESV